MFCSIMSVVYKGVEGGHMGSVALRLTQPSCVAILYPYTTDKSVTDLSQICYICCMSVTELSQINRVFTDLLYICHYTADNYKLHFVQIYYRGCLLTQSFNCFYTSCHSQ